MPRPFFMHIHIHSQTQRCTIRSKSAVLVANREGKTNGSGIDWFRADLWSCCLDFRRIRGAVLGNYFTYKKDAAAARRRSNLSGLAKSSISSDT
ncbi:hypothetical protein MLD38_040492 [Melastoma candidum]|nr:hypothetical protein MLD38_040492 [Melastoma candidum]